MIACLVHEAPDCVLDLVDNLRYLDPDSTVLLYDGGTSGVCTGLGLEGREGTLVHPAPRPLGWGRLHDFAIDCLRFALDELDFDALTVVDSDQLATRPGYSAHIAAVLKAHPAAGCLVTTPGVQPATTLFGPAQAAWRELGLWRPFLQRFPDGEQQFPHWTFWPGTVFTGVAARDVVALWDDEQLQDILGRSELWASEEVLLPSLVALAGHEVAQNPTSYDFVQYRSRFSAHQVREALARPDVFWIHPVPRRYDDRIRSAIRGRFDGYGLGAARSPMPARPLAPVPTGRRAPKRRLVSCVMPTHDRRVFVPQAIAYFLRQDLTDSELIVVDDGTDPVADLMPEDPRIRYLRLPERHTIGQKRNIGCAQAWGEVIVHWDDDDWMAPWRLSYQVEALQSQDADLVGLRCLWCCQVPDAQAWRHEYAANRQLWVADGTFCYRRRLWEHHPFSDTSYDIDASYRWQSPATRVWALADPSFYVDVLHAGNPARVDSADAAWHPHPAGEVTALMGDDWAFYLSLPATPARPSLRRV